MTIVSERRKQIFLSVPVPDMDYDISRNRNGTFLGVMIKLIKQFKTCLHWREHLREHCRDVEVFIVL